MITQTGLAETRGAYAAYATPLARIIRRSDHVSSERVDSPAASCGVIAPPGNTPETCPPGAIVRAQARTSRGSDRPQHADGHESCRQRRRVAARRDRGRPERGSDRLRHE